VIILLTIAEKEERGRNIAHCDIRSKRYSKRRRIKKKDKLVFENGVELFRYIHVQYCCIFLPFQQLSEK
jgi:hypothetical protein